jgi:uncharacterized Zn finger protein
MFYYCPNCASMKMPKVINHFPPKTVKCLNCGHMNYEAKFIKESQQKSTPLNYTH